MMHQVASVQKRLVAGWCEPGEPTAEVCSMSQLALLKETLQLL